MKIVIENVQESILAALRRCGYHFERTLEESEEVSAARSLGGGDFPRFHCYARLIGGNLDINLHLDQKRPSYKGTKAHAGEYGGELIEEEGKRIKSILSPSR